MCPKPAAMAVKDKKWSRSDAVREPNPVKIRPYLLLTRPISAGSRVRGRDKTDYKTHLKILCHSALKAASSIIVLSIIPLHRLSS